MTVVSSIQNPKWGAPSPTSGQASAADAPLIAPPPVSAPQAAPAPAPAPALAPLAGTPQPQSLFYGSLPARPPEQSINVDQGLINSAAAQSSGPGPVSPVTADRVATIDPSAAAPQAPRGLVQAAGYTAAGATGTTWGVEDDQTVAGNVRQIVDEDGPLMQQAATRARQGMVGRGLINSSMAISAGQAALYDAAMPMAQQDAQTRATAGRYNADVGNATSQFSATAQNQASQFGAGAQNDASRANAAATNSLQSQSLDQAQDARVRNAAATNEAQARDAGMAQQSAMAAYEVQAKRSSEQYASAVQIAMRNADAGGKLQLQQIDAQTRERVMAMEAEYKGRMQTSASMQQSFQAMNDSINRIMLSTDLEAGPKQEAINNTVELYNQALQAQQTISGLDLGSIVVGSIKAPQAAPQAPSPATPYGEPVGGN